MLLTEAVTFARRKMHQAVPANSLAQAQEVWSMAAPPARLETIGLEDSRAP